MGYLSADKRARICALLEEEYPSHYITAKENIYQSTIIRTKQRKDKTGSFKNQPKLRHLRLLTG